MLRVHFLVISFSKLRKGNKKEKAEVRTAADQYLVISPPWALRQEFHGPSRPK
jgi:hypothetical protein